ncbi:PLP-dependent aminotransferase family protein [Roseibium salinum]|uniref:PLP-dependent aminotransferase family protein n=1 Tax=Roseibium salinum TaxID=1604349 RepID=A0ABT3QWB3_9HYPH|nr:PLP-dependent aminotransferase family protein [Roseibium sp. DSM 29163]MCX2721214.1 PLP-dependent aminotransferase family protein [Roseibium sp. DSM 29163]MDN3722683.1 PLP-dependent aminotransferase family protein [Roseibium salinum]
MFDKLSFRKSDGPIYLQIAGIIEERIANGQLAVGDRLPPQRDIAQSTGVNLTTVTRAFASLQERGLVESRPGRGSIVADPSQVAVFKSAPLDRSGYIDLSVNRPATTGYLQALSALMTQLPADPRFTALQDFHAPEGPVWAREAMAAWMSTLIGTVDPSNLVVTNGAQQALGCVLRAIARPGDVIVTDIVTYQGIGALCRSLDLVLKPVEVDGEGMSPADFAAVCEADRPRAVFLIPTLHNPLTVTMSAERKATLAATARRHGVLIIEDDVYRALKPGAAPTFAQTNPDITIHINSLSKCVAPGLRLGAVLAPEPMVFDIAAMLRIDCWSISALNALIAVRMIEEGTLDAIIAGQVAEFRNRQEIVQSILSGHDLATDDVSPHCWLRLPDPWHGNSFVKAAHRDGVGVLSGEAFAVTRECIPHAVRINLGAARTHEDLRSGLDKLCQILKSDRRRYEALQ